MAEVLNKATQLFKNGDPEHALLLLDGVGESQECTQLRTACKRLLSQQYMYLLREAQSEGDLKTATEIAAKYRSLIGEDERVIKLLEETELRLAEMAKEDASDSLDENIESEEEVRNEENTKEGHTDIIIVILSVLFFALLCYALRDLF